jgi:hypothetical protein
MNIIIVESCGPPSSACALSRFGEAGSRQSLFDVAGHERMPGGFEWAHQDSNLGQAGYEPAALTAEL